MSFHKIVRRTHLYLAMFMLPWFLMYGITSLPFNHSALFQQWFKGEGPEWTVRFDRDYELNLSGNDDLKAIGNQITSDNELDGTFAVYRPNPNRINVYLVDFWEHTRITYFVDQKRLLAEDRRFRWDHFMTGLHARGGYQQDNFLHDVWAFLVDGFCLAMILWIATGIYMWWKIPSTRLWGWVALGSGAFIFVLFVVGL